MKPIKPGQQSEIVHSFTGLTMWFRLSMAEIKKKANQFYVSCVHLKYIGKCIQ